MNILIIDDNDGEAVKDKLFAWHTLDPADDTVHIKTTLAEADAFLETSTLWPDLVILDCYIPHGANEAPTFSAPQILQRLSSKSQHKHFPKVLLFSGHPDISVHWNEIVAWLDASQVADILPKSTLNELTFLLLSKKVALFKQVFQSEIFSKHSQDVIEMKRFGIITQSELMIKEWRKAKLAAQEDERCILIYGETGTGKELFAQAIHKLGQRKTQPFNRIDSRISEATARGEIFGYTKGAFTGADKNKDGLLKATDCGTLLFDDVHNLPAAIQDLLLSVLEEKGASHVGTLDKRYFVDIQFIFTANERLQKALKENAMSKEFLNRINHAPLLLPPLNDRIDDIPLLAHAYFERWQKNNPQGWKYEAEPGFVEGLKHYYWPGNIRMFIEALNQAIRHIKLEPLTNRECILKPIHLKYIDEYMDHYRHINNETKPEKSLSLPVDSECPLADFDSLFNELLKSEVSDLSPPYLKLWYALGENHETLLVDKMKSQFLNQTGKEVFSTFFKEQKNRVHQDPLFVHLLKALLYLSIQSDWVNRGSIRAILNLSQGQTSKVLNHLTVLIEETSRGNRKCYRMRLELMP